MIRIDKELLLDTIEKASGSKRLRMNHNFHTQPGDTLQRLLNAIEPGSYIQPHKHDTPDKREIFFALQGRIAVVEFDDQGNIADSMILDPLAGRYGAEIPEKTWHTLISLESGSVAYEFKDGPYDPVDDKNRAPWAPKEGAPEAIEYLREVLGRIGL